MSLSIPFPFCVATKQKGGQGWGSHIAGLYLLGRNSKYYTPWPFGRQVTVSLAILNLAELNLHPRPCAQYGLFLCWKGTLISQPTNRVIVVNFCSVNCLKCCLRFSTITALYKYTYLLTYLCSNVFRRYAALSVHIGLHQCWLGLQVHRDWPTCWQVRHRVSAPRNAAQFVICHSVCSLINAVI